MGAEKMAKRSIGSLMRRKLSDITNSDTSFQQLLQERMTLMQLIAERDEMIELNGAELRRLQADIKKLQQQNWNLAQSNSFMLALERDDDCVFVNFCQELNSGRERIKTLQHEISWRAALLKGKNSDAPRERVDMDSEKKNASLLSQSQVPEVNEGDEKAGKASIKASSNDEEQSHMNNRRRIRSKSTGSTTYSTSKDNNVKDNRRRLRRHSVTSKTHEHEPLENLFEIEDAIMLSSSAAKDGTGESSALRNKAPRSSFGRPLRKAAENVQTYKEIPINVKMRRLE